MRAVFCVRVQHLLILAMLFSLPIAAHGADKAPDPIAPLEVRSTDLAANQDLPVLCFTLSQTVARRPDMPLESFVGSDPEVKLNAVPRNNRLCLTGFTFGNGYTITLKSGLPGVSSVLAKDAQFRIQIPNRPPEFDFAAAGDDVLPRLGNDGLPVRSVNVPKIDIDLFRIADADLIADHSRPPLTVADIETFAPARGEHIWHGAIEPKADANRDAVTFIPVQQAVGALKPGIYVAVARQTGVAVDPTAALPTQYFQISDLGLAAYRGVDSLTVWVRSLATANSVAGTDVALIGRNNREIARSRTDDNGFVRFDGDDLHGSGGSVAVSIQAFGQAGDFGALDIDSEAGAAAPATVSALLYPDRKAYRPGDTLDVLALLRNVQGDAISKLPLSVTIVKPDGAIFDTRTLSDQTGGYNLAVTIPSAGAAGTWRLEAQAASKPDIIGRAAFDVIANDTIPLIANVSADAAVLDPTAPANIAIQSQYADGRTAPSIPGELRLSVAAAPLPFPAFPAFSFGLIDETIPPMATEPVRFSTDPSGKAVVRLKFSVPPLATKPLEAIVMARLFDAGGRVTEHTANIPVATQNLILGVRPDPGPEFAGETAHFQVIALSPDGARQEKTGAGWEILRREASPSWDWNGKRFVFRSVVTDTHVAGGTVDIPANAPAALEAKLAPGRYRIEVFDPTGEAISSARFMVGWSAAANAEDSDAIDIKPAKPFYRAGETTDLFIKPPYEADVALISADPRIRNPTVQHVPAAGAAVHFAIPQDAGVAMQLLATAIAPPDSATPNLTRRAFSRVSLDADPADRQLTVKLDLPAKAAPNTTLLIPVSVTGVNDEPVFVRIVASNEEQPDGDAQDTASPLAALIAANARIVTVRDNYGKIISASGLSNGAMQAVEPDKRPKPHDIDAFLSQGGAVTISSGIVSLDKNGAGKVPLAIPDFTGTLKIAAIAWSPSRTGQTSVSLPVHYPLTAALSLPPRLSPDDRADLTLTLDNLDGPRGEYHVLPQATGGIALQDTGELVANLAEHEERNLPITILAKDQKGGEISLRVTGPNGLAFERHLAVPVDQPAPKVMRHAQLTLKPSATLNPDPTLAAALRPEGTTTYLTAGLGTDFELNGLGEELKQKRLMASDEIVARASVYLAPGDVLANLALQADDPKSQLSASIKALAAFQAPDGGFGRWAGGASDPWLSALVTDFLTRCRAAGETVPDVMMDQTLEYLTRQVVRVTAAPQGQADPTALAEAAYAAKILAANGQFDLFRLRYFSDWLQPAIHEPVAAGFIADAFAILGDKTAAAAEFARAMALPGDTGAIGGIASDLDSQAILTASAIESGAVAQPLIVSSLGRLSAVAGAHRQFTTSEATWLFRAAATLPPSEGSVRVKVGDIEASQPHALWMKATGLQAIKNPGDKPLHISLTVFGEPAPAEVKDQGFELQRAYFDMTGKPADPAGLHQNDILVVVLSGRYTGQGEAHPVIVDPLPAGWDVEAAEIADPANRYPWLKDLTGTSHAQADGGNYVAVPNLTGERHEFKVAYVVRAAVQGQFALPGASIEDTAQPGQSARTAVGKTKVDPPS